MAHPIQNRADSDVWQAHFDPLAPKKGDLAPDFTLSDVNGENRLSLADFRGKKPVALIFGSFT